MHAVGGGLGRGYSINVPWDTHTEKHMPGDAAYDHAFEQVREPTASISCGQYCEDCAHVTGSSPSSTRICARLSFYLGR